jgi:hypothetical protein
MIHRIFLFVSLLLAGFSSFSQPYQPVGVENAHWKMVAGHEGLGPDYHAFVVRGDTLINSMAYKKLYYQDFANSYPLSPPYLLEEEYLWGLVRDDSLERKVYAIVFEPYQYGYQCPIGEEQLLFDFSILPGDSTAHCLSLGGSWLLDSTYVSFKYGANRRTLFSGEWLTSEIFEGIGSNNGLFGTIYQIQGDDDYWLHEYCIGADEDCGIISGTADVTVAERPAFIFPNPAGSELTIKMQAPFPEQGELRLYNTMGQLVETCPIPAGYGEYAISLASIPPAIYFYSLSASNELVASGMLVRE